MAEPALERIAFVTRRYSVLRGGVTRAVFALCLLAGMAVELLFNDRESGTLRAVIGMSNLFVTTALGIWFWRRSSRWLDGRFGRVRSVDPLRLTGGRLTAGVIARDLGLFLWQIGFFAAARLDDHYGAGSGYPSARFVFIAAAGLWFCVRLWPRSLHYAVPTVVAGGFALQCATLSGEQAIELWEVQAYATSLLAWTAAGLIDLAMLFKWLPRQQDGEPVTADA